MHSSRVQLPSGACPASAVILAARLAQTPLAIADAHVAGAPILFANAAFAALVDIDSAALVGRPLGTLAEGGGAAIAAGTTARFELPSKGSPPQPVALSIAAVDGADGETFCLLCSLVDARGDGADAAIARDAELLAEVAAAAGDLMRESAVAARLADAPASTVALDAVERATLEHP